MPEDNDNFPFEDDSTHNDREFGPETEELRQQIAEIHKKLTGENIEPITNNEIALFLRVINYNFVSLTKLLQVILFKTVEMDTTLMNIELNSVRMGKRLQQFFEINSMLDEIVKEDLDVSGSASGNKFIF